MNLKKCHQWLLQKQFVTKKDFVTAIGDIFTHVTAIADPWVGNGCHKGAHSVCVCSPLPSFFNNSHPRGQISSPLPSLLVLIQ